MLRLLLLLISACCWPHQAQVAASPSLDVLERDRVRFDRSLVEPLGLANLDDNALCLVLDQLLDNAFRHGCTGKTIRFTVRPLPQVSFCALELISIGSAPPVGDNELNRWQRPFARAEIERDGRYVEGAGLGLPLVRQLVEAWGGALSLTQSALASGQTETRVMVTVPLQHPPHGDSAALEGREIDRA